VVPDPDASAGEGQAVVITTSAVPGRKAPILLTAEMAEAMAPGSVTPDMAAERGGNRELTRAGETAVHHGVSVIGPLNLPSAKANHGSRMYATSTVNPVRLPGQKRWSLPINELWIPALCFYVGGIPGF
jgi:NAD/NADP transhydrogenase alpha subunit